MFEEDEDKGKWDPLGTGSLDPSNGVDEIEEINDESEMCDCDPDYKETQTVPKSAGASFGGFGGQVGSGETVIICKNCRRMYSVKDTRDTSGGIF